MLSTSSDFLCEWYPIVLTSRSGTTEKVIKAVPRQGRVSPACLPRRGSLVRMEL